ncbi:cyclic AMP-responsive element-binding protein 3-like protein 3-B [Arapaima gigas]
MADTPNKAFNTAELMDLLFDHTDGTAEEFSQTIYRTLWSEDMVGHRTWPAAEPIVGEVVTPPDYSLHSSVLSPTVPSSDFLDVLLTGPDSLSGSPVWSHSPSDSGISEDPPSDHIDSPLPPDSPAFHAMSLPPSQRDHEVDVAIDLGVCGSGFLPGGPPPHWAPFSTEVPLTIKDLLLSGTGESHPLHSQQPLQELVLNEDEKKLLAKEGVSLPSKLPLTKMEERILKKIRRKIRNKQSAQESRKKKKEYIDALEGRMAACSAHNQELQRKVLQLEKSNTSLMDQLRRLQAMLMVGSCKAAQTGTCVLVLLLSFSLILVPSLQPSSTSGVSRTPDFSTARVQSRSLRSVMEMQQTLPPLPLDRGVEAVESLLVKLRAKDRFSEAQAVPQNHSTEERDHHHHEDPITGRVATVSWSSRQDGPLHPHADDM